MRVSRLMSGLLVLASASLLAACSVLPKTEAVDTYLLPATPAATQAASMESAAIMPLSLRVTTPGAGLHLDSSRIIVIPGDNQLSVYQGAAWSDPAPILVRNRLLDAFRADGRIASLSSDERTLHADLELDSELRAFQSEYLAGRPEAVVTLNVVLVQTGSRRILASRRFEIREKAAGTAMPQVVQAFGKAGDRLSADVVEWTVQQAVRPLPPAVQ